MPADIKVKEAMVNRVVTITPDKTVLDASKLMLKEDIGSLIVTDGKHPIGILTREDIINKVAAKDEKSSEIIIEKIMTTNLITTTPEADLVEVTKIMTKHGYERIPVVSLGKLVGMISARDILRVAPGVLDILREHLLMEDIPEQIIETNEGDCELCGNYSEELHSVNGRWSCDGCKEEAEAL